MGGCNVNIGALPVQLTAAANVYSCREAASFPGRANGLEVNPRGQGPRAEADSARRLPHVSRAVRAA